MCIRDRPYLDQKSIRGIIETVWDIDRVDDVNSLTAKMVFGQPG